MVVQGCAFVALRVTIAFARRAGWMIRLATEDAAFGRAKGRLFPSAVPLLEKRPFRGA
jgi:hypothetical protein